MSREQPGEVGRIEINAMRRRAESVPFGQVLGAAPVADVRRRNVKNRAGTHQAGNGGDEGPRIGHVLDDLAAVHSVERALGPS